MTTKIAVAKGDGIGPEIMNAVLHILNAAGAAIETTEVEMGLPYYLEGWSTGMTPKAKDIIEETGILFKGPMETPKGKGVKSINVTARKVWSTYANKRVFKSLHGVDTVYSKAGIPIDITIVRENIEDTYGGIEHMLTHDVALCRRFITRPGSLQVHRYTFEMARKKGARKVTCGHKANIMKLTDGLFLECFYEVAKNYPDIQASDIIVDDLAMKLVVKPQDFDVVVLPNLQGDILSDLCAGLVGGLGFAPSANIGDNVAIFEAVHGTAPDIAGKFLANPTALLLSGIMMLRHIGQYSTAALVENALLYTLEQGYHTKDVSKADEPFLGTNEYAEKIVSHLGMKPEKNAVHHSSTDQQLLTKPDKPQRTKMMTVPFNGDTVIAGADYFVESELTPDMLADIFLKNINDKFSLTTISNRGTQVYPTGSVFTECINQYRVRLEAKEGVTELSQSEIFAQAILLAQLLKICSIELLMKYDGQKAYTLAQGQ